MDRYITYGKNVIHVTVCGTGAPIVILPGCGAPCPHLEARPLAEQLMDRFTVVIYEPPGYGFSDPAKTPRTVENIADEIHGVMQALGFTRYAIAAHSISGLYAMYMLVHYRDEISAFIALDISVACQDDNEECAAEFAMMAEMRQKQLDNYESEYLQGLKQENLGLLQKLSDYPFSPEDLELYQDIIVRTAHDPTVIDELAQISRNSEAVRGVRIPDNCPALMLIARENAESLKEWEPWHRDICGSSTTVKIMDCGHNIHLMKPVETAALITELLQKQQL